MQAAQVLAVELAQVRERQKQKTDLALKPPHVVITLF